jgi:hypothetical protein
MMKLTCWSCKALVTLKQRENNDGDCPHCQAELDLETYVEGWLEKLEKVGEIIDTVDNLTAALNMELPDKHHVKGIKSALPILNERLKESYFELGGENVWSENG